MLMLRNMLKKTKIKQISPRNSMESYVFGVKLALDQARDKISAQEKSEALRACEETIKWLDANTLADKEECEDKMNSLTKLCTPLMTKLYNGGGAGPSCGQQAGGFGSIRNGPTVEEVD